MPLDYRIDVPLRTVIARAHGVLTDVDMLEFVAALHAHPGVKPDFDQLLDTREVTKLELSGACLREIAADTVFGEGSLRAFVTGSEVGFGMARMYQMLRDESPDEIRIFQSIDEARAWLGLPADA
jgi:hypothetical protein